MIVCKYKFDKSIYENLIPIFNDGYTGYTISDEVDSVNSNHVIRTIECDTLPTEMRFGKSGDFYISTNMTDSLLEILDMNTSELTTTSCMFACCSNLSNISCNWNTSNVTDVEDMFNRCYSLTSLDVSNFDTGNVTNMGGMFIYCSGLTSLDVSNFDTGNVTSLGNFVAHCEQLTLITGLENFNTSNVILMEEVFRNCTKLTSLDLSNWNTSNVTNMRYMFSDCSNLTSLDVSNWNTSKVTDMQYMFHNCSNLTSLDVMNFDTSNVTSMASMFANCNNLTQLDVSKWNVSNVIHIYSIFYNCKKLINLNLYDWNTTSFANLESMFNGCQSLQNLDISNFKLTSSMNIKNLFYNISSGIKNIGMLYCDKDTVNLISSALNTVTSRTIWVKDTKASDYTATDYVTIKDYKEDNRTLYLNSPLLEGDEIVNKEGKLYHYHKRGKVVLDGRQGWTKAFSNSKGILQFTNINGIGINDRYAISDKILNKYAAPNTEEAFSPPYPCIFAEGNNMGGNPLYLYTPLSIASNDSELKQWLSENPTTVIYKLRNPYYELISDDPLIVQSYAEGKLDTSSIITPTSIQSIPYEEELTYLYTSTQYCIQFYSTANCTVDITLGGTKVESKSVSVGLNKIYITTPSTLVDNKLIINAKGNATISEVVVVNSNAEFDYFDGMKSSFEDCLVTDVDNENYGKYEVGVKIVGKNLFNENNVIYNRAIISHSGLETESKDYHITDFIQIKPNVRYIRSLGTGIYYYDKNYNFISFLSQNVNSPSNAKYCKMQLIQTWNLKEFQFEEGTVTTSYEPYKETNATIYLNSPLLQGDRIEVKDGKLCHYHKMGKVVLDGSEDENWYLQSNINDNETYGYISQNNIYSDTSKLFCNTLPSVNGRITTNNGSNTLGIFATSSRKQIRIRVTHNDTLTGIKQWLSENPTTVIYELANPYYEDITPIQSSFVISTVSEGDMEILTDLPIKSNITYLTNITSAVLMEQQLDELDNSTESLTNIVEDEINE